MVFASQAFLLFLLVVLAVYWLIGKFSKGAGKAWLIAASFFFYGYWTPAYVVLLAGSIVVNFLLVRSMLATRPGGRRTALLTIGVVLNIGLIAYYKYFAFLIESVTQVAAIDVRIPEIILPIGISFFTFQQIGLLVDTWKGRVAGLKFWDHVFFIAFFPQLIAGPIVSQHEMLPQLAIMKRWTLEPVKVATGAALFAVGLFKKTVLIDPFARHVDAIYTVAERGETLSMLDGWAAGVGYGFQIYFDFSGYSDMAIGLAFMFGLSLPLNFFSPYRAASIREFWRRWHVTLSRFLQKLLYIPMGGSRHGLVRTMAALIGTMTIGGLWHGAGWNFVIWGLLHGAFLSVNHAWIHAVRTYAGGIPAAIHRSPLLRPLAHACAVLLTFAAVSFTWVFFRAPDVDTALRLAGAMLGLSGGTGMHWVTEDIIPKLLPYFLIVWCLPNSMQLFRDSGAILHIEDYPQARNPSTLLRGLRFRLAPSWAAGSALIFLAGWFMMSNLSPFIYFQF